MRFLYFISTPCAAAVLFNDDKEHLLATVKTQTIQLSVIGLTKILKGDSH